MQALRLTKMPVMPLQPAGYDDQAQAVHLVGLLTTQKANCTNAYSAPVSGGARCVGQGLQLVGPSVGPLSIANAK